MAASRSPSDAGVIAWPTRDRLPAGAADVAVREAFPDTRPLFDPAAWTTSVAGEFIWSKQRQIMDSVRDHRYTAVPSCHDSGKSYTASRIVAAWIDQHPLGSAFVVSTAPSRDQVKAILWREVTRAKRAGRVPGRITLDARWVIRRDGDEELIGFGRRPADMSSFQGLHAEHVLVVIDEAGGVPEWLFDAADTLATNIDCRVLAIGNPDDPAAHFERVCRPGSGWTVIPISAFDTPNFTDEQVPDHLRRVLLSPEWVAERKKRWGVGSPRYISKVLGRFPEVSTDTLFPPSLLAQACATEAVGGGAGRMGLDVARTGDDHTVLYRNRQGQIRLVASWRHADTMQTTGFVMQALAAIPSVVPVVVDTIGVGAGVYDRLVEQGAPAVDFVASAKSSMPLRFGNRRAEVYWTFRTLIEDGVIDLDPADDTLLAQLGAIKYRTDSAGRTWIEPKDEMTKRGLPSPDYADAAVMSTFAGPIDSRVVIGDVAEALAGNVSAGIMHRKM